MTRVRVCRCLHLCAGTPRIVNIYFNFVIFVCCALLPLPLPYHVACIPPRLMLSSSLYFVATTVQQSYSMFVWTASMRVLALHMRVCDVCDVCMLWCGNMWHVILLLLLCCSK